MAKENVRRISVELPIGLYNTLEAIKKTANESGKKMTISEVINMCLIDYIMQLSKAPKTKNMETTEENK